MIRILGLVWVAGFLLGLTALADENNDTNDRINGIAFTSWRAGEYSEAESDQALQHLSKTGAGWVQIIATVYQDTVSSTALYPTRKTPSYADLTHVVAMAHQNGLKVLLKPHVDLWMDPTHWRGQIGEYFRTEIEWQAWFSEYQEMVGRYAEWATELKVDGFCIGTELTGTANRAADWKKIISHVKERYSGPLVYAANWWAEPGKITWWAGVDYIGIDAYFPLSDSLRPKLADLITKWETLTPGLKALSDTWKKPVLITEIGYRSIDGAAKNPSNWKQGGVIDLSEQRLCYEAAFQALYSETWIAGIFWWDWRAKVSNGGPKNTDFTPFGKPAEKVLRKYFND